MVLFISIIIIIFIIIALFAFPQFSPIPYFPSNYADKDLILKALDLKNNQTIIDLGAGDGWIVFEAAKYVKRQTLNVKLIAVEINPVLVLLLHLKRSLHPNKKNIQIIWQDFFNNSKFKILDSKFLTIYLYVSPWLLEKTLEIIKNQFGKCKIVSYYYPIKSLKPEEIIQGKNNIYLYNL